MTTAPFTTTINPRHTTIIETSPYSIVMLVPKEADVPAVVNQIVDIPDEATALAQLGPTTTMARMWHDYLESVANIHLGALPFTPHATPATNDLNAATALDALLDAVELAKLSSLPDFVLVPNYTGRATAASAIVTKLETVCADPRVGALGICDAYHLLSSPLADVRTWGGNNLGPDILAITNTAPHAGVAQWGSLLAAGHLCRYGAIRGIGSHPFNLSDHVVGVGTPTPVRVFSLDDSTAPAEVLADEDMTSVIVYDGAEYLWGGRLKTAVASDPRSYVGNAILAKRIVKRGRHLLAPFLGRRATSFLFDDMALTLQVTLDAEFGALTDSIVVDTPYLAGSLANVPIEVGFHNFIERIRLIADVYLAG